MTREQYQELLGILEVDEFQLLSKLSACRSLIKNVREILNNGKPQEARTSGFPRLKHDTNYTGTIAYVLKNSEGDMTIKEIVETILLNDPDIKTNPKSMYASVWHILHRKTEVFRKTARGHWTLVDDQNHEAKVSS